MYIFSAVAIFMIKIQAIYVLILMYKWANGKVATFEMVSVFPDTVWYMVFGLIAGLAGINGFGKQAIKPEPEKTNDEIN